MSWLMLIAYIITLIVFFRLGVRTGRQVEEKKRIVEDVKSVTAMTKIHTDLLLTREANKRLLQDNAQLIVRVSELERRR